MSFFQRIVAWFKSLLRRNSPALPRNAGDAARLAARQAGLPSSASQAARQAGVPLSGKEAVRKAAFEAGVPLSTRDAAQQAAYGHGMLGGDGGSGFQVGESDGHGEEAATMALTNLPPELLAGYDARMAAGRAGGHDEEPATMALSNLPPEMLAGDADSGAHAEWQEMQAFAARCEADGLDLAGLDIDDPQGFWQRQFAIEQAEMEGRPREQAVMEQGFCDEIQWERVQQYFNARWSELRQDDDGDWVVAQRDAFTNAALHARQGAWQSHVAHTEAANGQLFEPIAGVSLETYAHAAAAAGGMPPGSSAAELEAMLRERFGIDRATYDAAAAGWNERMSQDTTYALVTRYGELFGQAQTGAADAWRAPGAGGGGGGGEPVSFERYCEVGAAQAVWAENGHDVNAMLPQEFGISAMDWSAWASYWAPRMGTDIALAMRFAELDAQYRGQYEASLGGGQRRDDDLSF